MTCACVRHILCVCVTYHDDVCVTYHDVCMCASHTMCVSHTMTCACVRHIFACCSCIRAQHCVLMYTYATLCICVCVNVRVCTSMNKVVNRQSGVHVCVCVRVCVSFLPERSLQSARKRGVRSHACHCTVYIEYVSNEISGRAYKPVLGLRSGRWCGTRRGCLTPCGTSVRCMTQAFLSGVPEKARCEHH